MKSIFKLNQRVFDFFFGWGTVKEIEKSHLSVLFDKKPEMEIWYNLKGIITDNLTLEPTLATKEYTLSGFTQEPIINWSDYIGKWGKFWDEDSFDFIISKLYFYNEENNAKFITSDNCPFYNFKPLSEEQLKILGLE